MNSWSPFRGKQDKTPAVPRARGRRRLRLPDAADNPDAVLTDRDAESAARAAVTARTRPPPRAWELYGSQPVRTAPRQLDASDKILPLSDASCDIRHPVERGTPLRTKAGPDYGTGPAYDPSSMRSA